MIHNGVTLKNMTCNGAKVKKWKHNGVQVYSAGNVVTYNVDSGVSYKEEVDSGASCLSPKTFTPTKSGWTFVGWRVDTTASESVLTSKVMDSDPITLYAVFKQTVTLTTVANGVTSKSNGTRCYNNGNTVNPTFTVANPTKSGTTFKGWSSSASSTSITNSSISGLSLSASTTRYAVFKYDDAVLVTKTGYWFGYLNESDYLEIDAFKYSAVTLAGWSHMRAGNTASTSSGTAHLYLDGRSIASVTHGTGYQSGTGYNYNIDGTYSITSTSGTVKMYCSGSPVGQGLVVESGTATITGVGRTIVG